MKLTQKNFDSFLRIQEQFADALNHRMTRIEDNVKTIGNDVTKMTTNVNWITKLITVGITIATAIIIGVITKVI